MVVRNARKKLTGMQIAKRLRKKGFRVTVFKKKNGVGISITRKKK